MRITVISSGYPPAHGGVADYTAAWSDAMRQRGHDVSLVTSTEAASGREGVTVFRGSWQLGESGALAELVRKQDPDVVVIQYVPHAYSRRGGGLSFALLVAGLARRSGVPVVVNAHEIYGGWSESLRRLPWHVTQRVAAGVLLHASSAFVVTVKKRRDDLKRLFSPWRNKIHLLPIGPTILPTAADPGWRLRHGVGAETVVVATLGLGHPTQDTAQFMTVLEEAANRSIDLRLFAGGRLNIDHPMATNLGYLDPIAASQLLSASDIFALPLTDGISGRRSSAISALASNALVVSTAGVDTDHELFKTSGITMTAAGDARAFTAEIIRLAQSSGERADLRAKGQIFYKEHFAWEAVADQWEALLAPLQRHGDRHER